MYNPVNLASDLFVTYLDIGMLTKNDFRGMVAAAFKSLYDLVTLRNDPLISYLVKDDAVSSKEKGWRLHQILLNVINELEPDPRAPIFSREWRRHQLMHLRYVEAVEPQAVADQLAITRRHFYREHEATIEIIAEILWERYIMETAPDHIKDAASRSAHLELLRQEASRVSHHHGQVDLSVTLDGVLTVLEDMLAQNQLEVQTALPDTLPPVLIDRNLLRQLLMAILGYLGQSARQMVIHVSAQTTANAITLTVAAGAIMPGIDEQQEQLASLEEIAALAQVVLKPLHEQDVIAGFSVDFPILTPQTVLVIDDNEDILALYQSYLAPHHYHMIGARAADTGLELARKFKPSGIFLDLMMPEQDGWDVLQKLVHHPDTRAIPVVVCTVLKQKSLALSLGATAFLEKPITERALLAVLDDLRSGARL